MAMASPSPTGDRVDVTVATMQARTSGTLAAPTAGRLAALADGRRRSIGANE
jgi:hypothetical protein